MSPETVALLKGFRKVFVTMVIIALTFVLAMFGKLTAEFAQVAMVGLGSFAAANAVEHNSKKGP